jgi:hypothetical protein
VEAHAVVDAGLRQALALVTGATTWDVLRRYQGIPWVNTIAADKKGEAYYADIGSIPNVPNSKATGCSSAGRSCW